MFNGSGRSRWLARALVSIVIFMFGLVATPAAQATGTTTGFLEICKTASGSGVTGSFEFTVSGVTGTVTVPVNACSQPIQVTAGQVVVTETARAGFVLADVTTTPADRLVSKDLAARKATVTVVAGGLGTQTIATFTNKVTPKGFLEVCKRAAAGDSLTGSFSFTVTASGTSTTVTVPVGGCSNPIEVPAGPATVTEAARAGTELTAIDVAPADRLVSKNVANRTVTVTVVAGGVGTQTIVTFTNKTAPPATGTVKVCKIAGPGVTVGQEFTFTVGTVTTTAKAGSCSLPITVNAGNVTVTEAAVADIVVSAITSAPAGSLVSSDLAARTATVKVTAGQVTEVSFTNEKQKGTVKVCKIAGPGVTVGQEFTFTVGTVTTTAKAGSCSLPITLPVGNVTVKETVPAGFEVTAITVTGAGTLVSSDLATATAVVKVAVGVTEVNFTNKKKPVITGCTRTKGFYKNHEDVVTALVNANGGTLLIGGVALTAAQIDEIYGRNASNFLNQVSQQLITARLNQLSGASTPDAVQTAIGAAQALVQQAGGPLTGTATSQTTVVFNGTTYTASQLVDILSSYNEGTAAGGPPACG
jgi:hypothetical protein